MVECCRPVRDPDFVLTLGSDEDEDANGLMNNPRVLEVARRAVEGSLAQTEYDAYNFMADIGSMVAYRAYLRGYAVDEDEIQDLVERLQADGQHVDNVEDGEDDVAAVPAAGACYPLRLVVRKAVRGAKKATKATKAAALACCT